MSATDISIEAYMLQARSCVDEKIVTAAAHRELVDDLERSCESSETTPHGVLYHGDGWDVELVEEY